MKTPIKHLLAATAAALALTGTTLAIAGPMHHGSSDCQGMKKERMQERMAERHNQRKQELKDALQLTPEQAKALDEFYQKRAHRYSETPS